MPFRFGRRACRYAVSSKCAFIVCVHLLDRPLMDCVLTFESTGRDCLENVAHRIQLTDVCTFDFCEEIVAQIHDDLNSLKK